MQIFSICANPSRTSLIFGDSLNFSGCIALWKAKDLSGWIALWIVKVSGSLKVWLGFPWLTGAHAIAVSLQMLILLVQWRRCLQEKCPVHFQESCQRKHLLCKQLSQQPGFLHCLDGTSGVQVIRIVVDLDSLWESLGCNIDIAREIRLF
jgi:hypothetical protein